MNYECQGVAGKQSKTKQSHRAFLQQSQWQRLFPKTKENIMMVMHSLLQLLGYLAESKEEGC